jgi:hypothetical protein
VAYAATTRENQRLGPDAALATFLLTYPASGQFAYTTEVHRRQQSGRVLEFGQLTVPPDGC